MSEQTSTAAPDSQPTRRCPACGAEVAAGELFCETCGAEVAAGGQDAGPGSGPAPGPGSGPGVGQGPGQGPGQGAGLGAAPAAAGTPLGGAVHDGTLLDDPTAAATDRWRHAAVQVRDTDLAAVPPACAVCGGTVASDGYCEQCGAAAPRLRDHWRDQPAGWLAAVCDRGVRHARNEDAMAVAASLVPSGLGALVVCDGVSMAVDSDVASLAAARAARDALVDGLQPRPRAQPVAPGDPGDGPPPRTGQQNARSGEFTARIVAGGAAAQERAAAAAARVAARKNPPSCTFVAALVERSFGAAPGLLVVGWVGDSRAYWIPDDGAAVQLSEDDSWAAEAIAQGVPRAEAENMPQSHAITRWLGADAHDPVPRTRVLALERPGWVLLCSDGLWNYCSEADDLAELVHRTAGEEQVGNDPARLAERLAAWAVEQGGHDNITVALARYDPRASTEAEPAPPAVHPVIEPRVPSTASSASSAASAASAAPPVAPVSVDPAATLVEPPAVPLPPPQATMTSEPPGSGALPAAPAGPDPT